MVGRVTHESLPEVARPRLLEVPRDTIRRRHYSYRTAETYLHWMKRFILFSGKREVRSPLDVDG